MTTTSCWRCRPIPLEAGTQGFFSRYKNEEVTALLTQSRATTDPAKRGAVFKQIQDITYNDGYSVPLAYTPSINAYPQQGQGLANPGDRLVVAEGCVARPVAASESRQGRASCSPLLLSRASTRPCCSSSPAAWCR